MREVSLSHARSGARWRMWVAFGSASVVHVAAALLIARVPLRVARPLVEATNASSGELTISADEPVVEEVARPEEQPTVDPPQEAKRDDVSPTPLGASTSTSTPSPPTDNPEPATVSKGEPTQEGAPVSFFQAAPGGAVLALGAPNPFAVGGVAGSSANGAPPAENAPDAGAADNVAAKRRVDAELRRATLAEDRAKGMQTEGAIATAITNATYSATLPTNSRASFEIIVDSTGRARFITVGSADPGWQEVAKAALVALQKKQTRFAGAPKGAVLRMDMTVGNKLPNGQAEGLRVTAFGLVLKEGGGKDATTVSVVDLSELKKAVRNLPSFRDFLAAGADRTKRLAERDTALRKSNVEGQGVPYNPDAPRWKHNNSSKGAGSDADPSNLGAKPRTIVHAHTVGVTPLEDELPP